jgi:FixJ family two-component response regulator
LEGFAVNTYDSGAELLDGDDLDMCRCFVIAQRMPGLTGMELILKLRDRQVLAPAIFIVSHPSNALGARATIASVPIVEKPLLGNVLVDRIREVCRQERDEPKGRTEMTREVMTSAARMDPSPSQPCKTLCGTSLRNLPSM